MFLGYFEPNTLKRNLTYKTHLIKVLSSLDFSRTSGRLSQNLKTGGFRRLFLPENDFKTCSAKIFFKKHPDFGGLEINQRHEIQT